MISTTGYRLEQHLMAKENKAIVIVTDTHDLKLHVTYKKKRVG